MSVGSGENPRRNHASDEGERASIQVVTWSLLEKAVPFHAIFLSRMLDEVASKGHVAKSILHISNCTCEVEVSPRTSRR